MYQSANSSQKKSRICRAASPSSNLRMSSSTVATRRSLRERIQRSSSGASEPPAGDVRSSLGSTEVSTKREAFQSLFAKLRPASSRWSERR